MDKFVIEGGHPLNGEVIPSGNKNAALPLLAACLLTDQAVTLHNVPDIRDVHVMMSLIETLGASVELLSPNSLRIQAKNLTTANLDKEQLKHIRASILLAGPMTARIGDLSLYPPGGSLFAGGVPRNYPT